MALVHGATGSGTQGGGTSLNVTHFPIGAHTLLVVAVAWYETVLSNNGSAMASATYKGVAGSLFVRTTSASITRELWVFQGSFSSGSADAVFVDDGTYDGSICAVGLSQDFTGENLVAPVRASSTSQGTSTAPSVNRTGTLSTSLVYALLAVNWLTTTPATPPYTALGGGQTVDVTRLAIRGTGDVTNWLCASSSVEPGNGGTVTMSWTLAASRNWHDMAYEIAQALPASTSFIVPMAVQGKGPRPVGVQAGNASLSVKAGVVRPITVTLGPVAALSVVTASRLLRASAGRASLSVVAGGHRDVTVRAGRSDVAVSVGATLKTNIRALELVAVNVKRKDVGA